MSPEKKRYGAYKCKRADSLVLSSNVQLLVPFVSFSLYYLNMIDLQVRNVSFVRWRCIILF